MQWHTVKVQSAACELMHCSHNKGTVFDARADSCEPISPNLILGVAGHERVSHCACHCTACVQVVPLRCRHFINCCTGTGFSKQDPIYLVTSYRACTCIKLSQKQHNACLNFCQLSQASYNSIEKLSSARDSGQLCRNEHRHMQLLRQQLSWHRLSHMHRFHPTLVGGTVMACCLRAWCMMATPASTSLLRFEGTSLSI